MAYKIFISPRAYKEIENAIDYYALYSEDAPLNFLSVLKEAYSILETTPFFRVRYKNIRAIRLKKFPYFLYYTVNKESLTIHILSCFHGKRNPTARPKG